MIAFPLTRPNRMILARAFADVPRVDIAIGCALEDQMGKAFTDSLESPTAFMIELGGFFSYFAGELDSDAGHAFLQAVPGGRLLMSGSDGWHSAVQAVYGERLIKIERFNLDSTTLALDHVRQLIKNHPQTSRVQQIDAQLATQLNDPYLDMQAFDSVDDFLARGIGFCVMQDDHCIGSAYSSLVSNTGIEVSIFVDEAHRRQGIASAIGGALVAWCLARGIEPHWDAANPESCGLGAKLGYTLTPAYTAYFLKP